MINIFPQYIIWMWLPKCILDWGSGPCQECNACSFSPASRDETCFVWKRSTTCVNISVLL